jgi:8-oxo-dGTP diphosphatase
VTVVFTADGKGVPQAADDAASLKVFPLNDLPEKLAFDHAKILRDYLNSLK